MIMKKLLYHLFTSLPILAGLFILLGAVGGCDKGTMAISTSIIYMALGLVLMTIGGWFSYELNK